MKEEKEGKQSKFEGREKQINKSEMKEEIEGKQYRIEGRERR